jgi:hypothetical protein
MQIMGIASLLGAAIAVTFSLAAWFTNSHHAKRPMGDHTAVCFVVIFIMAFVLYCIGTMPNVNGSPWQNFLGVLAVAPMALMHAVGVFLLQNDYGDLTSASRDSWLFTILYALTNICGAFLSMTVLIRHFGFGLVAKFRFQLDAKFGKETEELFIFWGMNEPSYLLCEDILKHEKKSFKAVFVLIDKEYEEEQDNLKGRMLSFINMQSDDMQRLQQLHCHITQPSKSLSSLRIVARPEDPVDIIRGELNMNSLSRVIAKTTGTVHIFFLDGDEANNLRSITNLQHDSLLLERANSGHLVRFYASAESTYMSRALDYSNKVPAIEMRMIDPSEHCVHFLKSNPEYHPVRYVDIDTERNFGTVKSGFHSLIVGFGYTGQEALRFLYEYGAFVDSRSTMDEDFCGVTAKGKRAHVARSPFRCDIVDNSLGQRAAAFFAEYPAMRHSEGAVRIELHEEETDSDEFIHLIDECIATLNYVVVATGDDDLNLDIAVGIFSRIRRVRQHMNRLNIFIHCASAERAIHFRTVTEFYNQGYAEAPLVLFGTNDMVFCYEQIVDNEIELKGRLYNESYCRVNRSPENYWKSRHDKLVKRGTLDALSSLHRKEWQDCQDAYHAPTKAYLYEKACPKRRSTEELIRLICGNGDECNFRRCLSYPTTEEVTAPQTDKPICVMTHDNAKAQRALTDEEELFLLNLSRLEHLRWNASHEALGYISVSEYVRRYGDNFGNDPYETRHTCSEQRKCHNCLVGWEELDRESLDTWNEIVEHDGYRWNPDYKLADYGVVANALYHTYAGKQNQKAEENQ